MAENKLKQWLARATIAERDKLVHLASTSTNALQQTAGAYRSEGKLSTTPEYARRLELAAARVHREGLPVIKRTDLCAACNRCEFAKNK